MKIHADLRQRAVVDSEALPWIDSPLPGVRRRMLERDGDEVARATSIVAYAPRSYFDPHSHDAGEEFLVLDGVFSDEMGDFPAGMYVRNPPGSAHRPHTDDGCIILVKLRQFEPADRSYVRIDTNTATWQPGRVDGLRVMPLFSRGSEQVALVDFAPGATFRSHVHPGGEEIFVLGGELEDEHGRYPRGTWIRNPPGSAHAPYSRRGARLWVKTGHLDPAAGASPDSYAAAAAT